MNAAQAKVRDQLAAEYRSVGVREDSHSQSVYLDCFDIAQPEACIRCGSDSDHLSAHFDHAFAVAQPVATFRVSPSGFTQNITPLSGYELVTA